MSLRESELIAWIKDAVEASPAVPGLRVGIGDDGAVLDAGGRDVVVTVDMLIDGIDVVLAECGFRAAGRKAMAKSLSDVAAMGVEPWTAFVSMALPPATTREDAHELVLGLIELARRHGVTLAGGDTKRSPGPLIVDVTLTGRERARPPVLRSGALAGDSIWVTGPLGGAALGRHLTFEPRVLEGLRLNERHQVHAMLDLSDGLSTDLHRLCDASDVGAVLESDRVPLTEAAFELSERDGRSPLEHALHDGEDYELLFTIDPHGDAALANDLVFAAQCRRVGRVTERAAGVRLVGLDGAEPLAAGGFEHTFGGGGDAARNP
jgi:thiamine-monophosphate kinase